MLLLTPRQEAEMSQQRSLFETGTVRVVFEPRVQRLTARPRYSRGVKLMPRLPAITSMPPELRTSSPRATVATESVVELVLVVPREVRPSG